MKSLYFILIILLSLSLLAFSDKRNSMRKNNFRIMKGLNVSHWLSQSNLRGVQRENYITLHDIELIAELGFDHIRLPIDEEQMWDEEGKKHKAAFDLMHKAIQWSIENNLRVVVDLHVLRSHHFNQPDSRKLWEDKSAQEGFIKYWKELSSELKQYSNDNLAYEPLNEAVSDNPDDWNKLVNLVIAEIRKLEPERSIIMGSNNWQQVGTFKDLKVPDNDPNIILSFHYYEPFLLTHYHAPWTNLKDLTMNINYPGEIVDTNLFPSLSEEELQIVKEHQGYNDVQSLAMDIYQAVKVAEKYELQLYCGEFGCFPTTDLKIRQAWYKDLISVFDKYDIAWAHWNYKNDFPLVDEELKPINEIIKFLISTE